MTGRKQTEPRLSQLDCICENAEATEYYINMGYGRSIDELKQKLERRAREAGKERTFKFKKIYYFPVDESKEKWEEFKKRCVEWPHEEDIVKDDGDADITVCYRRRENHKCRAAYTIISMTCWKALQDDQAEEAYWALNNLKDVIRSFKRAATDGPQKGKGCDCNRGGQKKAKTWGCGKHARQPNCSQLSRKVQNRGRYQIKGTRNSYKVQTAEHADVVIDGLADEGAQEVKILLPNLFQEMTLFSEIAAACRIGRRKAKERPFSGATIVSSKMVHVHKDENNCLSGLATMMVFCPEEERQQAPQLHILYNYACRNKQGKGIGFALPHGSIHMELGAVEPHASTPCPMNDKGQARRIGIIFYLHRHLNYPEHGKWLIELRKKMYQLGDKVAEIRRMGKKKETRELLKEFKKLHMNEQKSYEAMKEEFDEENYKAERTECVEEDANTDKEIATDNAENVIMIIEDGEHDIVIVKDAPGQEMIHVETDWTDAPTVVDHGQEVIEVESDEDRASATVSGVEDPSEDEPKCDSCGEVFPDRARLRLHVNRGKCRPKQKPSNDIDSDSDMEASNNSSSDSDSESLMSGSEFSPGGVSDESSASEVSEDSELEDRDDIKGADEHQDETESELMCRFCKKIFQRKDTRVDHERKRLCQKKGFKCNACGHACATKEHLERHTSAGCGYICRYCERRFGTASGRRRHQSHCQFNKGHDVIEERQAHDHVEEQQDQGHSSKNVCRFCEQKLSSPSNARRHEVKRCQLRHQGCKWCFKLFANRWNAERHQEHRCRARPGRRRKDDDEDDDDDLHQD